MHHSNISHSQQVAYILSRHAQHPFLPLTLCTLVSTLTRCRNHVLRAVLFRVSHLQILDIAISKGISSVCVIQPYLPLHRPEANIYRGRAAFELSLEALDSLVSYSEESPPKTLKIKVPRYLGARPDRFVSFSMYMHNRILTCYVALRISTSHCPFRLTSYLSLVHLVTFLQGLHLLAFFLRL